MTGAVIFNQSECCVCGRTRCLKKQWRPCRLSFLVPDLSPARCARRLVTRGFAARATSFITTKMRACSQANLLKTILIFTKACESLKNISLKVLNERVLKYLPTDHPIARVTPQASRFNNHRILYMYTYKGFTNK